MKNYILEQMEEIDTFNDKTDDEMKFADGENLKEVVESIEAILKRNGLSVTDLNLGGKMTHRAAYDIINQDTEDPGWSKMVALVKAIGGRVIVVLPNEK